MAASIFLKIQAFCTESDRIYLLYAPLLHRPQHFTCWSLAKSGCLSINEGIPDLKLRPLILRAGGQLTKDFNKLLNILTDRNLFGPKANMGFFPQPPPLSPFYRPIFLNGGPDKNSFFRTEKAPQIRPLGSLWVFSP